MVSRRALFGLGLSRAMEGAGLETAAHPRAPRPSAPPSDLGEADGTRLGAELAPLGQVVLRRLLPAGGGGDLLVVAAGDGTPLVDLALAAGHRVTAVERGAELRARGIARLPKAAWHGGLPADGGRFDAVLAWFGATHEDPRTLAAGLRAAARPDGLIAVAAWTPVAMARLRCGPRPAGHRPESWSRYETAYRHFFDLPGLDVEPLSGPDGLDAALVLARAPSVTDAAG